MVRLKNITKNSIGIEADYYPEDYMIPGHIVVSYDGDLIDERVSGYSEEFDHSAMAQRALLKLLKEPELPREWTVMWY